MIFLSSAVSASRTQMQKRRRKVRRRLPRWNLATLAAAFIALVLG